MKKHPTVSPAGGTRPHPAHIPRHWAWHYRTLLTLRDHLLSETGDRSREPTGAMEPPSLHAEDLADELYDRDLARALPTNPVDALREVEDAIGRLETGTYGRCEATGRVIPSRRLRAMPWCRRASGDATPPRAAPPSQPSL